jgi:DNA polymerase I-like protein with 3'-5' exonuclease and polymerase domains
VKDPSTAPLARLLAEARNAGATFRISGAHIVANRLHGLRPEVRTALRGRRDELWELLGGAAMERPALSLMAALNITPVVPQTEVEALELIAEIEADSDRVTPAELRDHPGLVGLDIETMASPGMEERPPIKLTMKGLPYTNQADFKDTAALDPHRSTPRLVQLYGGGARCLVLDTRILPVRLLAPVISRRTMVIHNAAFELNFLTAAGVAIPYFEDTLQAAALLLGVRRRSLEDATASYLGVELDKTLQTSDWGAEKLSEGQIAYAAIDAIAAFWMWLRLREDLEQKGRMPAYRLQRDVTPVVVRMMQHGILLDREAHASQATKWSVALSEARQAFTEATSLPPPAKPADIRAYLKRVLPETDLQTWPTTPTGQLSTRKAYLEYMAHLKPIQAILTLMAMEKLLSSFGTSLVDKISPRDGRLHPSYKVAAAKTGRFSSEGPNIQQLPGGKKAPDFRNCVVASSGKLFVAADFSSMELRAGAAISGDQAWNADFAAGVDPHQRQAAVMLGIPESEVTKDQRNRAKPINFGVIYGSGGRGLAASAWNTYGIRMTIEEALEGRDALFRRYPEHLRWMDRNTKQSRRRGCIEIGRLGRVIEEKWEAPEVSKAAAKRRGAISEDYDDGPDDDDLVDAWFSMLSSSEESALRYTLCCNAPVQGACADAGMLALIKIDTALRDAEIDGTLAMFIHDEIVIEVVEHQAEQARGILVRCMTEAFAETFPGAPLNGLVSTAVGKTWGAAKP